MKNICTSFFVAVILIFHPIQAVFGLGIGVIRQNRIAGMPMIQQSDTLPLNRLFSRLGCTDIIFDTAVAKNQLFNYRLNIKCYNTIEKKDYLFYNYSYSLNRLELANTFGFGFIRTRHVRVWAGPQFTISYEFTNRNGSMLNSILYNKIGSVAGVNFHMGDETTLAFELGFRAGLGLDLDKSTHQTLLNTKPEPIASLKLIFRSWDTFVPSML